ncbi:MAG: activator-dependent family glycosyltransferase [Pseudonocardiaceae bacterium]
MRVLFTSLEGSHVNLMVPTAWALRTAGHEVLAACKPEVVPTVTQAGLTAVPIDCPPFQDLLSPFQQEAIGYYNAADPSTNEQFHSAWEELLAYETIIVPSLYAPLNHDIMIDRLVELARRWRPDLVIWETLCLAGAVAAVSSGAAHARLVAGPEQTMQMRTRREFTRQAEAQPEEHREDPTAEWLNWTLERVGSDRRFDETMLTGQWTIDTRPPSLREDIGMDAIAARYVPYNGRCVVPDWLCEPPRRPRVCLTLGVSITSDYELFDLDRMLGTILLTLAELDIEIVAAIADSQRAQLPPIPDNVRVTDFVPLNELLPSCSAVVHHGGYQTKATAELHGIPQVIVCGWEWVSETMGKDYEEQGTLLSIPIRQLTAARLSEKVMRVLNEPSFAENARRLRQEILAMPTPNDIVPLIEKMTDRHGVGP